MVVGAGGRLIGRRRPDPIGKLIDVNPLRPAGFEPTDIPASGAWRPGMRVGNRRFVSICDDRVFALEGGGSLSDITIAYETWGSLDATASNAVLICHALTGDSHATGPSGKGHPTGGWWADLVGPGRAIDTDKYFVVCANVLGGCQGTTGPASVHPDDGLPYGSRFPVVSIRDIVRTQARLADVLGIDQWLSVVGGSMGGMQVLEWAVMYPDRLRSMINIASAVSASPLQIGWSQVGRLAIVLDPKWNGGDYYHAEPGEGPHGGLMVARRIAQLHYRSDVSLENRFGRSSVDRLDEFDLWQRFQVESYLDHHGQKLARRFDANSYLVLNKAMDLHDIGRGRGGSAAAISRIKCSNMIVSVDSDTLYTPRQQDELRQLLEDVGLRVDFKTISSEHGHDGFLIEFDQMESMIGEFLEEQLKD